MSRTVLHAAFLLAAIAGAAAPGASAADWTIARVNHMTLTPPGGVTVAEMSGVAYVGPVGGAHRFIAAEETKGELVQFDVAFTAAGAIAGISAVAAVPMSPLEDLEDYEGVAFTRPERNSVFLSDEDALGAGDSLGLREVSLATGAQLQAVVLPAVFANRRANLGFESLARSPDGAVMWTANEQALAVDGPVSSPTDSTDVRLLRLNVAGDAVAAGPQYVYRVEPMHGSTLPGASSGLSDLAVLPDGTLLALERSLATASPLFLNRIYAVDFAAATDVSVGPAAAGLAGQSYQRVGKELLWSGAADGSGGQNLEGLTLGPQLASGSWVLLGVVDDGDPFSGNVVVAFTATATPSADFDENGVVDGADFLRWQRGLGETIGATHAEGDADRDGAVDQQDLAVWRSGFPAPVQPTAAAVPEPATALLLLAAGVAVQLRRTRRAGIQVWPSADSPKSG